MLETFKPKTILVEDGPLQSVKKQKHQDGVFTVPAEYDLVSELGGSQFSEFVNKGILKNSGIY